jgi:divalent metal cation (Fe/Co/Zn/Cd) transporter
MSTSEITKRITESSRRHQAAFVGFYYLLTILTGAFLLFFRGSLALAADLIASALYIAMTVLLYELFRPRDRKHVR